MSSCGLKPGFGLTTAVVKLGGCGFPGVKRPMVPVGQWALVLVLITLMVLILPGGCEGFVPNHPTSSHRGAAHSIGYSARVGDGHRLEPWRTARVYGKAFYRRFSK